MVIPREHGAWGMMLVPLATGAIVALPVGMNAAALTLFILAAMSLFWLRTPVEAWLGTSAIKAQTPQERAFVLRAIIAIGLLAAASAAALLWNGRNRGLLAIGAVAALAFAVQAGVKKLGRKGRMPAQVIGAIGLTSTAAAAYYVATGKFDHTALALWLANWLFAGNQIHFVQVRIRSSRAATMNEKLDVGLPFFAGQVVLIGVVLAACRFQRISDCDCSGICSGSVAWNAVVCAWPTAPGCAPARLQRTQTSVAFRCAAVCRVSGVVLSEFDSPILQVILLQPLAGDCLHGPVPILPPHFFHSQLLYRAPEEAKRARAMDGVCQLRANVTVTLFVGEVLHHPPLVDMNLVGQRQHAFVFQRAFDFWQRLAHPFGHLFPTIVFCNIRLLFIEGDDLAGIGIEIGTQLIALEIEGLDDIAQGNHNRHENSPLIPLDRTLNIIHNQQPPVPRGRHWKGRGRVCHSASFKEGLQRPFE